MIRRWRAIYPNDGGYVTEDKCGKLVYYADHEAIVKELVEALEYIRNSLTDETDKELYGIDFANELYEIDTAIVKAKGV